LIEKYLLNSQNAFIQTLSKLLITLKDLREDKGFEYEKQIIMIIEE